MGSWGGVKEGGGDTRKRGFPLSKQEKFQPHQPFLSPPSVFGHILASQTRLLFYFIFFFFGFVSLMRSEAKQSGASAFPGEPASPFPGRSLRQAFAPARPQVVSIFTQKPRLHTWRKKNSLPFLAIPRKPSESGKLFEKKNIIK